MAKTVLVMPPSIRDDGESQTICLCDMHMQNRLAVQPLRTSDGEYTFEADSDADCEECIVPK